MQEWMYKNFLAIICQKKREVVKKGRIGTNASANYSYIIDALSKNGCEE